MPSKAINTTTGFYFVAGKGFVTECLHKGTALNNAEMAFVNVSYDNVKEVKSKNAGNSPEWADCGCGECHA